MQFQLWMGALAGAFLMSSGLQAQTCDAVLDLDRPCEGQAQDLAMNAVQAIGSHNSYHQRIPLPERQLIDYYRPDQSKDWDYGHESLSAQLSRGMRQIELDIYYDPRGGKYADPLGPRLSVNTRGFQPYDPAGMDQPGFKVLHMQDIDVHSSCATLVICLREIAAWSGDNPDHIPILIMFNTKQQEIEDIPGVQSPLRFTRQAFDELEAEIASVFSEDHILTPDDVRGEFSSLREAVTTRGWPSLNETRGRVFFLMDEGERVINTYMGRQHSLEGKLLFVKSTSPEADHAALFVENDPVRQFDQIQDLVARGFIVRTRSDANLREAYSNDRTRLDAALNSGAQYVTTDLYVAREDLSDYVVALPQGQVARCNPLVRPAGCRTDAP
ncbi:phosphatidylinositol-specific phospholipase C1-like protein [Woodsholea maritima]|uniref:phosphatidylinositol-specific phospholipase C1-like protein n=1 Tax=Woodsholea maritima TaxID=240237 RepID=UPI00036E31C8|nr:phosphatidylinositol-specific phospholipase C1-like protein [Woodsholea maritima]